MIKNLVTMAAIKIAKVSCVGTGAEGYDLYVLLWASVDEVLDESVDDNGADVGAWNVYISTG